MDGSGKWAIGHVASVQASSIQLLGSQGMTLLSYNVLFYVGKFVPISEVIWTRLIDTMSNHEQQSKMRSNCEKCARSVEIKVGGNTVYKVPGRPHIWPGRFGLAPATYYLLPVTYYLPPTTYHLLPTTPTTYPSMN